MSLSIAVFNVLRRHPSIIYAERDKMSLKGLASNSHLNSTSQFGGRCHEQSKNGRGDFATSSWWWVTGPLQRIGLSSNEEAIKCEFINSCF